MTTLLNQIADNPGARKKKMLVGRGIGCTKGKTCGRGVKGQKARTGVSIRWFEGGQMPIYRRLPKRGFNNYTSKELEIVNLGQLQSFIDSGKLDNKKDITMDSLISAGLIKGNKDGVKILGNGQLKSKINITASVVSKSAIEAIERAGGKAILSASEVKPAEEKDVGSTEPAKKKTTSKKTK